MFGVVDLSTYVYNVNYIENGSRYKVGSGPVDNQGWRTHAWNLGRFANHRPETNVHVYIMHCLHF